MGPIVVARKEENQFSQGMEVVVAEVAEGAISWASARETARDAAGMTVFMTASAAFFTTGADMVGGGGGG